MEIPQPIKSVIVLPFLITMMAFAQGPGGYDPGTAQGLDLSGNWGPVFHEDATERGPGPELVNYLGIPITERARLGGLSYDASRFTVPARSVALPHSSSPSCSSLLFPHN